MHDIFTSEFFTGNRVRLRQLFAGTAPIVVTANGQIQYGTDSTLPFHQDASFWYLTGIEESDIFLVMDKDHEYLVVPERDAARVAFDGAISDRTLAQRSGIAIVVDEKEGWKMLSARLKRAKHIATLAASPARIERFAMYANPARAHLIQKIKEVNAGLELLDLREQLMTMRVIKQKAELEALQTAIDITIDAVKFVSSKSRLPKYAFEYEIEADLTQKFRGSGTRGHAFEPIVASGRRATTLHNMANNGALSADDLLVVDIGAEVEQYDADITRTVALGQPTQRQQAVFDAVCEVQDFALNLLKPGTIYVEYEKQIELFMGKKLRELGLIKTITHEKVRQFYPHATSHFLGLDTHDVGDYGRPLEPNMVLTCEPGIYIPNEGIGVRIEDDILITLTGYQNLSGRLPRSLV